MRRYLIVANQTPGGERLSAKVACCLAAGPCRFHVVVPATGATSMGPVWGAGDPFDQARRRLDDVLARLGTLGAEVDGEVGDPNPLRAIADVVGLVEFDEIIVSTAPAGLSGSSRSGLPRRIAHTFGLPVSQLVLRPEPVA